MRSERLDHRVLIGARIDRLDADAGIFFLEIGRISIDDLGDRSPDRDRVVEWDLGRRAHDRRRRERAGGQRGRASHKVPSIHGPVLPPAAEMKPSLLNHAHAMRRWDDASNQWASAGDQLEMNELARRHGERPRRSQHDVLLSRPRLDLTAGAQILDRNDPDWQAGRGKPQAFGTNPRNHGCKVALRRRSGRERAASGQHRCRQHVHRRRSDEPRGENGLRALV